MPMKTSSSPRFVHHALHGAGFKLTALFAVGVGLASAISLASVSRTVSRDFTPADVDAILAEVQRLRPSEYNLRLPKFVRGQWAGTETYGTMPITQVQRLATSRNVMLNLDSNIIGLVMDPNDASQMASGARATNVPVALDNILQNISINRYQYLR